MYLSFSFGQEVLSHNLYYHPNLIVFLIWFSPTQTSEKLCKHSFDFYPHPKYSLDFLSARSLQHWRTSRFSKKIQKGSCLKKDHFLLSQKGFKKKDRISMAMLTLDAASETSIKKALPFRHTSNLRDASFSSYLNGAEETFTHKLAEPSKNGKPLISTPFEHIHLVSKKSEDNEIDIFSADKYFNEGVDDQSSSAKFNQKMVPPPKLEPLKQHTRSATPSVRSESSWNSQNALLHGVPRNQQAQKTNKANYRRSFLANLGCNCTCGDKSSVDIDATTIGERSPSRNLNIRTAQEKPKGPSKAVDLITLNESQSNASWIREDIHCIKLDQLKIGLSTEDHFRFPVFDSNTKTDHVLEMQRKQEEDDPTRKSIEVFGSPIQRKGKKSLNMLTWDAIVPTVEANEISENSRGLYNDAASDASSDLFEIESFSMQASDGMSSAFTQTCYAPSEASIEWSVVTASAADFSVISDIEESRPSTTTKGNPRGMSQNERNLSDREIPKRRSSGILSGCYSQKAVNVAGDVYRTTEKTSPGRQQKPEFLMPMTRFDKRNAHFSYDTRLLYKH